MPFRCVSTPTQGVMTLASSAPVHHRDHVRRFLSAAVASMLFIFACACGERTNATCAMRGSTTSRDGFARPAKQPAHVGSRHRAADIGIGPVERGEEGR